MDTTTFIIKIENGEMSNDEFIEHAQAFVDSGVWRHLQGSWHRTVQAWAEMGYVNL